MLTHVRFHANQMSLQSDAIQIGQDFNNIILCSIYNCIYVFIYFDLSQLTYHR